MEINLHSVENITIALTEVRGNDNCKDHNTATMTITCGKEKLILNLFGEVGYRFPINIESLKKTGFNHY